MKKKERLKAIGVLQELILLISKDEVERMDIEQSTICEQLSTHPPVVTRRVVTTITIEAKTRS